MNDSEIQFEETIELAYKNTHKKFRHWANDTEYRDYIVPPSRRFAEQKHGFAIFYTPPIFQPKLLVVGQNPSNFAGAGRELTDTPNAEMFSGIIPREKNYDLHTQHFFGNSLINALDAHPTLFASFVYMNVWHFQRKEDAENAPPNLRKFCETTSNEIVHAIRPLNVLCFGKYAFRALTGIKHGESIEETKKSEFVRREASMFWYVPHLTGRRTRGNAKHDLPIVLNIIASNDA
jgi:hypothetical protein